MTSPGTQRWFPGTRCQTTARHGFGTVLQRSRAWAGLRAWQRLDHGVPAPGLACVQSQLQAVNTISARVLLGSAAQRPQPASLLGAAPCWQPAPPIPPSLGWLGLPRLLYCPPLSVKVGSLGCSFASLFKISFCPSPPLFCDHLFTRPPPAITHIYEPPFYFLFLFLFPSPPQEASSFSQFMCPLIWPCCPQSPLLIWPCGPQAPLTDDKFRP